MKKMIKCKTCSKEIASNAKVCPSCGSKNKKPFYKRTWVWVLVVLILLSASGSGGTETVDSIEQKDQSASVSITEPTIEPEKEPEIVIPSETMGQKNALSSAFSYLNYSSFSKSGLIEQLEFESFSHEDAVYAVDRCGADWNEQAGLSAEAYLKYSSFSRDGLIEQLEFEGFSHEQAVHGVNAVGY